MTALGLLERVKGWFGGTDGGNGKRAVAAYLARPAPEAVAKARADEEKEYPAAAAGSESPSNPPSAIRHPQSLDPLDPAWMQSLEDLPVRVAESAAERAAATRALEQVAEELQGHRQTTRVLTAAIRRLPDIATHHAELTRETNQILERQSAALESMLDGLAALRAAFNTVEESSRRHLKAIALLESSHRQILFEYQTMFLRSHRLVGYVAAVAVILAAGAIGGLAYVAYMVFLAA
ncbi:MAG: hypothetical protein IMZ55_16245 [Acidobacteria bacterium]|nr:hypothetical protein [Planctomycetota bacterium]MBE3135019.1 hypothetical protein [Acidobacteriota bacterium]